MASGCEVAIFGELRREKLAFSGEKVRFWFGLSLVPCAPRYVDRCSPPTQPLMIVDSGIMSGQGDGWLLLQLSVLSFGLLVDGDVGVGVFPEGEEVLICSFCLRGIALHGISAGELQASQCAER